MLEENKISFTVFLKSNCIICVLKKDSQSVVKSVGEVYLLWHKALCVEGGKKNPHAWAQISYSYVQAVCGT